MPEGTATTAALHTRVERKFPRLPDQVRVDFGPTDLIAEAILALDHAAREREVYLSIGHDLRDLVRFNSTSPPGWFPIRPMFDPDRSHIPDGQGFWIRGTNSAGDIVLTHAGRLYAWTNTTLKTELEQLSFFYDRPGDDKSPDESCEVETDDSNAVSGRIVFGGSNWVHPDYRGRGLAYLGPRVTRAIGLTRWYPDFACSMAKAAMVANGIDETYGWRHVDSGAVHWHRPRTADKTLSYRFGWMTRGEIIDDLKKFSLLLRPSNVANVLPV